jgi:hypothetical protein
MSHGLRGIGWTIQMRAEFGTLYTDAIELHSNEVALISTWPQRDFSVQCSNFWKGNFSIYSKMMEQQLLAAIED